MVKTLETVCNFGYLQFAGLPLRALRAIWPVCSATVLRSPVSSKHAKTFGTVAKINSPLPGWPGRRPMCSFYRVLQTKIALTLQKPEENTGSGRPPRRRHLGLLEPSRVAFGQLRPPRPPDGFDLGQCSASRGKNNECPERFEHFPLGRRASENGNRPT